MSYNRFNFPLKRNKIPPQPLPSSFKQRQSYPSFQRAYSTLQTHTTRSSKSRIKTEPIASSQIRGITTNAPHAHCLSLVEFCTRWVLFSWTIFPPFEHVPFASRCARASRMQRWILRYDTAGRRLRQFPRLRAPWKFSRGAANTAPYREQFRFVSRYQSLSPSMGLRNRAHLKTTSRKEAITPGRNCSRGGYFVDARCECRVETVGRWYRDDFTPLGDNSGLCPWAFLCFANR